MASILSDIVKRKHNDGYVVPRVRQFLFEQARKRERGEADRNDMRVDLLDLEVKELTRVLEQFKSGNARDRSKLKFHPSQMHSCPRAVFFSMMGAPRDPLVSAEDAIRMHLIFSMGDSVHMRWQVLAQLAGIAKQIEIPIDFPELDIEGHADGIVQLEPDGKEMVWEIKSINARNFKTIQNEPKPEHVAQLRTYMHCLGIDEGLILYECKDNHELAEFLVEKDDKVIEDLKRMVTYQKMHFARKVPPPKEGDTPSHQVCRWCNFKRVCHDDNRLEFFTKSLNGDDNEGKSKKRKKRKQKVRIGR